MERRRKTMNQDDLKKRTKMFSLRVLEVVDELPNSIKGRAIGGQLVRSGSSTGANYRAACRARSKAEFISKLGTVIEEADETAFWLEIIMEGGILPSDRIRPLWSEANEIVSIMTASRRTAEHNRDQEKN